MPDRATPSATVPAPADGAAVTPPADTAVDTGIEAGPDVAPRRCSRCRATFPGVEERNAAGHVVWWLCSPCHEALLG
jgi:hypothetical protein